MSDEAIRGCAIIYQFTFETKGMNEECVTAVKGCEFRGKSNIYPSNSTCSHPLRSEVGDSFLSEVCPVRDMFFRRTT